MIFWNIQFLQTMKTPTETIRLIREKEKKECYNGFIVCLNLSEKVVAIGGSTIEASWGLSLRSVLAGNTLLRLNTHEFYYRKAVVNSQCIWIGLVMPVRPCAVHGTP